MQIDLFSDPVCPWCYIGKKRLDVALAMRPDISPRVTWRTFRLNPGMPDEGMDRAAYLSAKFGGPDRAERIYASIATVGRDAGISFRFDRIKRTPSTTKAHRLLRYIQEAGLDASVLMDRLFAAYFLEGQDIGDTQVLIALAEEFQLPSEKLRAFLDSDSLRQDVESEDMQARRLGIEGVPCFILAGRYAIAGAQEPETFMPLFDLLIEDARSEIGASTPRAG